MSQFLESFVMDSPEDLFENMLQRASDVHAALLANLSDKSLRFAVKRAGQSEAEDP